MLRELSDLYIPSNERQLRTIQRKGEDLDKHVRTWAQSVVEVLPRGLPLNPDEIYLLCLFLAQQRRLNMQMDAFQPDPSLWASVRATIPFMGKTVDPQVFGAVHRVVATRLDSDIDRAGTFFCQDHHIPPESEPAIDWRVATRFMAQSIYSRVATLDPKKIGASPRRFEIALMARDLAADIVDKRHAMFTVFAADRAG